MAPFVYSAPQDFLDGNMAKETEWIIDFFIGPLAQLGRAAEF